jgi:type I protein arginine methyltransferase
MLLPLSAAANLLWSCRRDDMYSLFDYGEMLADSWRCRAYSEAISASVRPGDTVLEIGCGPGLFSLLACRAGARRVYAIDSEEIVHHARELAAANGFADRIEFLHSDSRKVKLPEQMNVIISDIRGSLPLFNHAAASIEDARQRFLSPGGIMIPERDILKAAIIDAAEYYSRLTLPWRSCESGIDLSHSLLLILNGCYTTNFTADQLLTESESWWVLDYQSGAAANAAADLCFKVAQAGTAHGICVWFETELFDGIGFSTAPSGTRGVYGQRFFPWPQTVALKAGQEVQVRLGADLVGEDYVWRWETEITPPAGAPLHFRQSTFQGADFTPAALRCRAADFVPALSEGGQVDRWLLQAMDGKTSLQQIAQAAAHRFPSIFPRWEDALHRAAALASQFSR